MRQTSSNSRENMTPVAANQNEDFPKKTRQSNNNNVRLHDIEEVLEMAETRCNTLQDQLDQMKFVYGTKKNQIGKFPEKISGNFSVVPEENPESKTTTAIAAATGPTPAAFVRQNSCQIGTDASGAAVRTINSILNGITSSVNRLVEIHTPRQQRNRPQIGVVPPLEIPSSPTTTVAAPAKSKNLTRKKSTSGFRRRILSRFQDGTANKIVELYHNDALVRRSDSEMSFRRRDLLYRHSETSGATYALPTVASKMKQVTKKYLRAIDLRTIPFCPAISTTQSHNIGINIQQVMNIVKNRQPIDGISPTLAHNIGLAAEKLNAVASALTQTHAHASATHAVASKCPLMSRTRFDACALQEQARNLPEAIEEVDESQGVDQQEAAAEVTTTFITGPSGDVEIKTKKTTTWKNPETTEQQCTCAPDYQQQNSTNQNPINRLPASISTNQNQGIVEINNNKCNKKRLKKNNLIKINKNSEKSEPFFGGEKDLRQVLSHLHCDFDQLNRKYEYLCQKSLNDKNSITLSELEKLEIELEKKEEEIGMVVALCKEVQALKRQVKQLKEKKSQATLEAAAEGGKFNDYNHPEAAFHLTRLLKQIQHYQMRYKSNLTENQQQNC